MAKKQETTAFLSLDLLYTPKGLEEAISWLTGQKQCPFAKPQEAAQITITLLKAKYGISSLRELRELDKKTLEKILEELKEEEILEKELENKPDSYIPPYWLRRHWEIEASKHQLEKQRLEEFIKAQNRAWLNQVKKRYGASLEQLPQAYEQANQELNKLFARNQETAQSLKPKIEQEIDLIIAKKAQDLDPKTRAKIKEAILEKLDYGFISLQSEASFAKSLEKTVRQTAEELGKKTNITIEPLEISEIYESAKQRIEALENIEQILERITTSTSLPSGEEEFDFFATPKETSQEIVLGKKYPPLDIYFSKPPGFKNKAVIPNFFKKIILGPVAKPLQFLVRLAPEDFQKASPGLYYASLFGLTTDMVEEKIRSLDKDNPEADFFKNLYNHLKAFEDYHPKISFVFRNFFSANKGREISLSGKRSLFSSLSISFLNFFKKTTIGKAFSKTAAKALLKLGLSSVSLGWASVSDKAKKLVKAILKASGLGYLGLLAAAAIKGTGALVGAAVGGVGGLIGGAVLGAKIGASLGIFGGGPIGALVGGAIGLVAGGIAGFFAGDWLEKVISQKGLSNAAQAPLALADKASAAIPPSLANTVPAAVAGTLLVSIVVSQIQSTAFIVPYSQHVSPWQAQSEYIRVEKGVAFDADGDGNYEQINPEKIENIELISQQSKFYYQISITAVGSSLDNVRIKDVLVSNQESGIKTITPLQPPNLNEDDKKIQKGEKVIVSYEVLVGSPENPPEYFYDSILSNTVLVTALVEATGKEEKSFKSTALVIGDPPQDCPMGWPIDKPFYITQGPNGSYSHQGFQAIDLSYLEIFGRPVKATHQGIASWGIDDIYGKYVFISGTCKTRAGKEIIFTSFYAHLNSISIEEGQKVNQGAQVGTIGNSGNSTGPHLHYELRSANDQMKIIDYIPLNQIDLSPVGGDISKCSEQTHCPVFPLEQIIK